MHYYKPSTKNIHLVTTSLLKGFAVTMAYPRCLAARYCNLLPVAAVIKQLYLKVLTNGKRGGLKVVAFDKSPLKLFTLRFSTKSVQAPSCKRP
jgi:hypothetical protein